MHEPNFWWREPGVASTLLAPISFVYGAVAESRMRAPGTRVPVPVVCVGNFTLGGTGKTPTAIAIAAMLADAGFSPFCLSRGFGGRLAGPLRVDPQAHNAADVGDEALLLARAAPTIVAYDRLAGAREAISAGATVIVMDDGLQNSALAKDFTLALVDGARGIGNGCVFPGGPLRAPIETQVGRADAILVVGAGAVNFSHSLSILRARIEPDAAAVAAMKQRKVLAFAGIGDPERFFQTVRRAGIAAPVCQAFDDHHRFSGEEAGSLIMRAEGEGLSLLTTEKDHARMSGDPLLAALYARAHTLPVAMVFEEEESLREMLLGKVRR